MEVDKEMSLEKICSECSSCWNIGMRRDDVLYEKKSIFARFSSPVLTLFVMPHG